MFFEILQTLGQLFPNFNPNRVSIKYIDDDGDYITITSDMEVMEAIQLASRQDPTVLRLIIVDKDSSFATNTNTSNSTTSNTEGINSSGIVMGFINAVMNNPQLRTQLSQQLNNPQVQNVLINFLQQFLANANDNGWSLLASLLSNLNASHNVSVSESQRSSQPLDLAGLLGSFLPVLLANANAAPPQTTEHASDRPKEEKEQDKKDHERKEQERKEQERKEQEEKARREQERLEQERKEQERVEQARKEARKEEERKERETLSGSKSAVHPAHERYLARFIRDVSIVNGTVFLPGQHFYKTWRLANDGNVAWPVPTKLVFLSGDKLSSVDEVVVPKCINPGEQVDVTVSMRAPMLPGKYVSYWRLVDTDGIPFGMRVWLDITVVHSEGPAQPEPAPTALPSDQPSVLPSEVSTLLEMGFDKVAALDALIRSNNDVSAAIQYLCSD